MGTVPLILSGWAPIEIVMEIFIECQWKHTGMSEDGEEETLRLLRKIAASLERLEECVQQDGYDACLRVRR